MKIETVGLDSFAYLSFATKIFATDILITKMLKALKRL